MTLTHIRRLFVATVLVQGFHMVEHILQVMQKSLGVSPAHGLIGAFNLEWIHFTYNAVYLILLGVLFVVVAVKRVFPSLIPSRVPLLSAFLFLVIVQGYHVVEHTVKLQQHIMTGLQGTPGILGAHLDLVWFHFLLNLAVYIPLLLAFYGLWRVLFHRSTVPICTTSPCPWVLPA